jgi:20S proteasome subunit beta 3
LLLLTIILVIIQSQNITDIFLGTTEAGENFAIGGTAADFLNGTCEAFYKEDMGPDELFEAISQCLLASLNRDAMSGWGANVYIL